MTTKPDETGNHPEQAQVVRALGCFTPARKEYTAYAEFTCPHCGSQVLVRFDRPRAEDEIRAVCDKCGKEVLL